MLRIWSVSVMNFELTRLCLLGWAPHVGLVGHEGTIRSAPNLWVARVVEEIA